MTPSFFNVIGCLPSFRLEPPSSSRLRSTPGEGVVERQILMVKTAGIYGMPWANRILCNSHRRLNGVNTEAEHKAWWAGFAATAPPIVYFPFRLGNPQVSRKTKLSRVFCFDLFIYSYILDFSRRELFKLKCGVIPERGVSRSKGRSRGLLESIQNVQKVPDNGNRKQKVRDDVARSKMTQ